jgi:hypothetical protein
MDDLRNAGKPVAPINPAFVNHAAHGEGPHVRGHAGSTIATNGAPKRQYPVHVHSGMIAKSRKTGQLHVNAHSVDCAEQANPGNPLRSPLLPIGKNLHPVAIKPGMRSRTSPGLTNDQHFALGRLALEHATKSGGTPADELKPMED